MEREVIVLGYMFYQNLMDFHFKSMDQLFSQDHKRKFIGFGSDIFEIYLKHLLGYDGRIVNLNADNRFIANEKLRMGVYNTRLIAFNPFNCEYKIEEQDAYDIEDGNTCWKTTTNYK